jgi:hypothetical protein
MSEFKDMLTLNRIRGMINKDPTLPRLSDQDKEDIVDFLLRQRDEIDLMIGITRATQYTWLGELVQKVRAESGQQTPYPSSSCGQG